MSQDVLINREVVVFQETEAKTVGNGIRELRLRCGLPLTDFAHAAHITDDYLIRLEEGNEPKVEKVVLEDIKKAGGIF